MIGRVALAAAMALVFAPGCARRSPIHDAHDAAVASNKAHGNGPGFERAAAPELDGGVAWLGTDAPLSLEQLRGHVVILDFWTYCCINCMHVIPELQRVEREFAGKPVVVIGVHSGKFDAEKDPTRIRESMARYGVAHPVVVDSEFAIWTAYGVHSWPTLVVIDTQGRVVGSMPGEPERGFLSSVVAAMLVEAENEGTLAARPVEIHAPPRQATGALAYPGKLAVAPDGRIAIADSNHHRIVLVDQQGQKLDIIGSGIAGSADGAFEDAAFRRPQGLAFDASGAILYVADTENHQVRQLDLNARTVRTIAGTGEKGSGRRGGNALDVALRSPWDIAVDGDTLYIAMAGSHQIWRYHKRDMRIEPYAGSGRESIVDGPVVAAAFSQPSGLSLHGRTLYVADSEVSAIRSIDLERDEVQTIVGKGLFEFGDVDGERDAVRLQHALGVVYVDGALYVADTYNNKIKRVDPRTGQTTTLAGGTADALFEPGGLAATRDGRLLIADTNNHRLRMLALKPASKAGTSSLVDVELAGVAPPAVEGLVMADTEQPRAQLEAKNLPRMRVDARGTLGPGSNVLAIELRAPENGKLSQGAPVVIEARAKHGIAVPARTSVAYTDAGNPIRVPVDIKPRAAAGAGSEIDVDLTYFWCTTGDEHACIPERAHLVVHVEVDGSASPGEATFTYTP